MLTLEFVLLLPLLLIAVLGVVEFALLLLAGQAVSAAASVAAREASLPGASQARVERAVAQALAPWRFAPYVDPVVVDPPLSLGLPTGQPVAVTVSVASLRAVPDLLKFVGLSLAGQKLSTTYVARKE